jgi:hypothetical protein
MRSCSLYGLTAASLFLVVAVGPASRAGLSGAARLAAPTARAAEEPASSFKPAVVVRIKAIDDLLADARYLVKQIGREEEVKQFEGIIKSKSTPKGGLVGIDRKKPIGLYGSVAARLDESQGVLLLPIADEKTFLEFLDGIDLKPEKDANDLYTLNLPNSPFPVQFRFANGYLYATVKFNDKVGLPAKDSLPPPATILAGGEGLLSLTANIDRIPMEIRKLGISGSSLHLGQLKDQTPPGETEAQKKLREAILDEAAMQIKSVLTDGSAVVFKLDVDHSTHDLSASFSFSAKDGSPLAKDLSVLGKVKSLAAALVGSDSAMNGFLHLSVPANIRKALSPVVDEGFKKALDKLPDAGARDLLTPLADSLKATAKEGTLDVGVTMRGPAKNGKYTLVGGVQVTDGDTIEKEMKKVIEKLPEDAKKSIKLDVATAKGVAIHRITPENVKPEVKELFGEGPVFFALRKDALIFTMGEKALDTLKESLPIKPATGKLVQVELSLNRIVKQLAAQNPAAPEAAKQAFKEEGSDKVRLSVAAGSKVEVKLNVKSGVIAFAALMDKAKKDAEK